MDNITTIRISKDIRDKLKKEKVVEGETIESVIKRLLEIKNAK
jgi:predicted CopG family antitoxin